MGKYEQGLLGPFSGLVGPVVGASFRGKNVMRGRPRKTKKKPTPGQVAQRAKFTAVTHFLKPAKEILLEYFGTPFEAKSCFNLATSYYLKEAVEFDGTKGSIIYNKALFSSGSLMLPQNLELKTEQGKRFKFTWIDNSQQGMAKATDRLMVVVYAPAKNKYEFFLDLGNRSDESVIIHLPAYLSGKQVHCWAFMASANHTQKSTSQYLGEVTVI